MKKICCLMLVFMLSLPVFSFAETDDIGVMYKFIESYNAVPSPLKSPVAILDYPQEWLSDTTCKEAIFYPIPSDTNVQLGLHSHETKRESTINPFYKVIIYCADIESYNAFITTVIRCCKALVNPYLENLIYIGICQLITSYYENGYTDDDFVYYNKCPEIQIDNINGYYLAYYQYKNVRAFEIFKK